MIEKRVFKLFTVFAAVASLALLAGCGGGGSSGGGGDGGGGGAGAAGGTGVALGIAEKVSVVDAGSGSGKPGMGKPLTADFALAAADALASTTEYKIDLANQFTYVDERSTDAFNTVNEILCSIAQTQYDLMVNQGDYIAQIDVGQCEAKGDASSAGQSSQNQSSGANATSYEYWTVNSYRADNSSPHIVAVWVNETEDMGPGGTMETQIQARATITASATAKPPFGLFELDFVGYPKDSNGNVDTSQWVFKGFMNAVEVNGQVQLQFGNKGNETLMGFPFSELATLARTAGGSTGSGTVEFEEHTGFTGSEETTATTKMDFAYDAASFIRQESGNSGTAQCFDRASFDTNVWRYALYYDELTTPIGKTAGDRVTLNSGFPIRYRDSSNVDHYGWVGYWGLWFDDPSVSPSDGNSIYKMDFSGGAEVEYTISTKGGKLVKHVQRKLDFADIVNVPLDYWNDGDFSNYRVKWDGANFVTYQKLDQTTWTWANYTGANVINIAAIPWSSDLYFWSQSLGGSVQIKLDSCTDNGNSTYDCTGFNATATQNVISYSENTVTADDTTVPATLYCLDNCPDVTTGFPTVVNISLIDDNPWYTTAGWYNIDPVANFTNLLTATNPMRSYTFSTSGGNAMLLTDSGTAVVLTGTPPEGSMYQWGLNSGPLFEATAANKAALACEWNTAETCGWQAWSNITTFYTWETGPNDWNRYTVLTKVSDSSIATFDPPMQVTYVHAQTDTAAYDYKYNGISFVLDYGGFGDLWGIPGHCVNEQGADTDCGDWSSGFVMWLSEFTIPDGATVTDGATTYYVLALEKEQHMKAFAGGAADAACTAAISISQPYTLVDPVTEFNDPSIGAEPTVTAAPAVVAGELQITL